jgi:hypothetical protein
MLRPVNYKYGLLEPTQNLDKVLDQMQLLTKYYNELAKIEAARRDEQRAVLIEKDAPLQPLLTKKQELDDQIETLRSEIKQIRARTRSRSETAEQREKLASLTKERTLLYAQIKDERKSIQMRPDLRERMQRANLKAYADVKLARKDSSLYWGTYLLAEAAMDAAQEAPWWYKGEPSNPRLKVWRGAGAVSAQIQHGMTVEKALNCTHTQLRLDMEKGPPLPITKNRMHWRYGKMYLRIGSDGRAPVWAVFPILLHRPLPPKAMIQSVTVHRIMVAERPIWEVTFALKVEASELYNENGIGHGAIAVDIGWRKLPDGNLRIAYAMDEYGLLDRDYTLTPQVRDQFRVCRALQRIRQRNKNRIASWFNSYSQLPGTANALKVTLNAQDDEYQVFHALLDVWANNRQPGDEDAYNLYAKWARQDKHLWQWKCDLSRKAEKHRLNEYRCLAKEFIKKYSTLVIENFDLRTMDRKPKLETKVQHKITKRNRREAALSEFRQAFINAFIREGGRVIHVDPAYTTQKCYECGYTGKWDAAIAIDHTCESCGKTWDQDRNAALNILSLYRLNKGFVKDSTVEDAKKMTRRAAKRAPKLKNEDKA